MLWHGVLLGLHRISTRSRTAPHSPLLPPNPPLHLVPSRGFAIYIARHKKNASANVQRNNQRAARASYIGLAIHAAIVIGLYFYRQKRMAEYQASFKMRCVRIGR